MDEYHHLFNVQYYQNSFSYRYPFIDRKPVKESLKENAMEKYVQ